MNNIFIADFGSGNTCENDTKYIRKMIESLAEIDTERKVIIKWQLFKYAGINIPLEEGKFLFAYDTARRLGFQTTASVFDQESLNFLLNFDTPFIKIANRPELYPLIGEIPRKIPVITSIKDQWYNDPNLQFSDLLCCVSNYPAKIEDYEKNFGLAMLKHGISDHTENWNLFEKYQPHIFECHFKLPDSVGYDSGSFARTPDMLKYILGVME
jgi:sialic acid synthase SpsE